MQRPYAEHVDGRDLIVPVEKYGIKLLSIGFFVDPDQATLWRGGMASNALKQLIGDAIDLPPGTSDRPSSRKSDIHLTVVQTLALTGNYRSQHTAGLWRWTDAPIKVSNSVYPMIR